MMEETTRATTAVDSTLVDGDSQSKDDDHQHHQHHQRHASQTTDSIDTPATITTKPQTSLSDSPKAKHNRNETTTATTTAATAAASTDSCSTTKTSSNISSTSTLSVADADVVLFGTINADIADTIADRVTAALKQGVLSLPILSSSSSGKGKKLLQSLQRVYMRHVDVMEVYAARTIFTLSMYRSRRRQRILDCFQSTTTKKQQLQHGNHHATNKNIDNKDDHDDAAIPPQTEDPTCTSSIPHTNNPSKESTASVAGGSSSSSSKQQQQQQQTQPDVIFSTPSYTYPTKDQIPSKEQILELQEQTNQLRIKLKAAQERRQQLVRICQSHNVADQLGQQAEQAIRVQDEKNATNPNNLYESITAAVMGHQGLEQLTTQGKELLETLEETKRQRATNDTTTAANDKENNHRQEDDQEWAVCRKKKRLSMTEQYRQDRGDTTTGGLATLRSLLQHGKQK